MTTEEVRNPEDDKPQLLRFHDAFKKQGFKDKITPHGVSECKHDPSDRSAGVATPSN